MKQQRHQVPFALWIVWKLFCLHSGHPLSKITLSLRVGSGHKPKPFRGWSPGDTDPCWTESNISDITVDTQHSASLTSLACEIKKFMKAQVAYYKEMWRHVTHATLSLTNNPLIQQLYMTLTLRLIFCLMLSLFYFLNIQSRKRCFWMTPPEIMDRNNKYVLIILRIHFLRVITSKDK